MKRSAVAAFAVGPLGAAVLGFISLPLSTWIFSPADIGRLALLQTVTSVCVILFGAGLDQAYLREYHNASNRPLLLRRVLLPGLYALLATLSLVCLLAPHWASRLLFGFDRSQFVYIASAIVLCAFVSRYLSLVLRMAERGLAFSMSQLLPKALFVLGLLVIWLVSPKGNFASLIAVHGLSIAFAMTIFAWNTRRDWENLEEGGAIPLAPLLRYGVPMMTAGLAHWVLQATDRILLRQISTFGELGVYSVASGVASVAATLSTLFTTIWIPTAFKWAEERDRAARIQAVAEKIVAIAVIIVALAGALSSLLGYLLPPSYRSVRFIFVCCTLPPLFYAVSEVTGVASSIARKGIHVLAASLFALSLNLAANLLLIPRLGAAGAAVASAVSFLAMLVARSEAARRFINTASRSSVYVPATIVTAASVAYAILGERWPLGWEAFWIVFAVSSVTYYAPRVLPLLRLRHRRNAV